MYGEVLRDIPYTSTYPIVFRVVLRLLDGIAADDGSITVVIVGFVGREVDLTEKSGVRRC